MITAKFGSKKFEVSNKKIYTPNGLSFSEELNIEETEVSGKKPTVSFKGIKLQGVDFEVKLDARFVDVKTEIAFWKKTLLAKKSQNLVFGNYTIGKFFLTKYDVKEITMNKKGVYTSARLSLSFTEDGAVYNKANTKKTTSKSSGGGGIGIGTMVKPKGGTRWYYTAESAYNKYGRGYKPWKQTLKVTNIYKKNGKIVCVNLQKLGWMRVEDVLVVSAAKTTTSTTTTKKSYLVSRNEAK